MNVIEMYDIHKSYGEASAKTEILKGVSVVVGQGEFVAITGPSGSGKSTLMNIIGLLDTPDSGTYSLNGFEIKPLKDRSLAKLRLRYIGFVFQSFNLIPGLSALENVELPMVYNRQKRNDRRKRAKDLLEMLGLAERLKNRPSQLSGGQQQRVAIARALANQPPIILADEPTGNLDTKTGEEVMNILRSLHNQGSTVVLVTHDPHVAKQADRVITVKDGLIWVPAPQAAAPPAQAAPVKPPLPPTPVSALTSTPVPRTPVPTPAPPTAPKPATSPNPKPVMPVGKIAVDSTPAPAPEKPAQPQEKEIVISISHDEEKS